MHDLLTEFERLTGYPVLVNTSLNGPGEPIIETPRSQNALRGRWENLWSCEQTCIVNLVDRDAVIDKLVYTASRPRRRARAQHPDTRPADAADRRMPDRAVVSARRPASTPTPRSWAFSL